MHRVPATPRLRQPASSQLAAAAARQLLGTHQDHRGAALPTTADPWLAPDKLYHFLACATISLLIYGLLPWAGRCVPGWVGRCVARPRPRLGLSLAAGAVAGLAKEAGDARNTWPFCPCSASARDLVADGAGVVAAAALLGLCQIIRRIRTSYATRPPPVPAASH